MCRTLLSVLFGLLPFSTATAADNLIVNGDFEQGLAGWTSLWTRTPGGQVKIDAAAPHGGRQSARIEHTGAKDWSFAQQKPIDVQPGQIYDLSGWVRVEGSGNATLCVTPRNARDEVTDWSFAGQTAEASPQWRPLRTRFLVPAGTKTMLPRLIGNGPATVRFDDVSLVLVGTLGELRAKDLPKTLKITGEFLDVTFDTAEATLAVVDRRSGRRREQRGGGEVLVLGAREVAGGLDLRLLDAAGMLRFDATVRLDPRRPEVVVELTAADLPLARPWAFPHPFTTGKGDFLVMPVNEGISYPVDDETLGPMHYHLYGGHGLCMAWYGVVEPLTLPDAGTALPPRAPCGAWSSPASGRGERPAGPEAQAGLMTLVETPDDAAVRVPRREGRLCLAPEWVPQKGKFGPPRRLRYVFFDQGGYVAMAKRYREHARQTGLLKTLAEKRKANPHVDLLVGAVNVWCWDRDAPAICREMQSAGIGRILWSNRAAPDVLEALNALGVLTSRYDIYQDTMDPAEFPRLRGVHPDWTTDAWPKDLVIKADGQWEHGWEVDDKEGRPIPCGVLCDRQAVDYARRRIPEELKTHPYRCRFIDTTTASPWRECYAPGHPMTRSESRGYKMDLLRYVNEGCGLVTGSETGHDAAVPFVHYFEGMLSLGPYRVSDSGRRIQTILSEVPPRVAKFQTGHYYRLPLWELVYHDCVVSQWYWGDYNNKLPAVWDRRDLWNALYGAPPMFMFNRKLWEENRRRFVASYQTAAAVARATGYSEMLSHRWLTEDHAVQETRFAGGVTVTVNFGEKAHKLADGATLGPLGHRVAGVKD